jgi:hypothetical protein
MGKYSNKRSSLHEFKSKQQLASNMKKKIQTTMIGALSSIEDYFGFLWEGDLLSQDQKSEIKNKFDSLRSEILDKGNRQLRNVDAELQDYNVAYIDRGSQRITFFTDRGDSNG